jgi:hypothetical protein
MSKTEMSLVSRLHSEEQYKIASNKRKLFTVEMGIKSKNITENSLLEYSFFSVHIILLQTIGLLLRIYLRNSISVRNGNEKNKRKMCTAH